MNLKAALVLWFVALGLAIPAHSQQISFSEFAGYWSGSADGEVSSGKRERLRCTTNNSLKDGGSLRMVLRCANATGVSLQIYATIAQSAGKVSGTWEERTYNISGTVSGSMTTSALKARVHSPNFKASISVQRTGSTLNVSVIPSEGTGKFTVDMSR